MPDLRLHLVYGSSVKGEETIKKTMAENEKIERGMKYGAGTYGAGKSNIAEKSG